jgi:hypothetical protein
VRLRGKEVVSRVGGGLDALGRLPLPALRGGSGPDDPPARKLADPLDTIRHYDQLQTVIYTDGSAVGGVKRGGSLAVVTSGDPGNPHLLGC